MKNILIKIISETVKGDGSKRRRGPKPSIWGKRIAICVSMPVDLKQKAMAMAKVRKLSLSGLIERLLLNEDEIYRDSLARVLRADERLSDSLDLLRSPEGESSFFDPPAKRRRPHETKTEDTQQGSDLEPKTEPQTS